MSAISDKHRKWGKEKKKAPKRGGAIEVDETIVAAGWVRNIEGESEEKRKKMGGRMGRNRARGVLYDEVRRWAITRRRIRRLYLKGRN